ncbi:MAG: hypothetical protein ACI89W_001142, partial [Gammaproteobacteria bacterium]
GRFFFLKEQKTILNLDFLATKLLVHLKSGVKYKFFLMGCH